MGKQTKAKTADTPVCKCGGRTALIKGMWYFSPDREPYLNGVEEESKVYEGEEYIHGFKCDDCGAFNDLFSDEDDYRSHIANLEAQNKELREALEEITKTTWDNPKYFGKNSSLLHGEAKRIAEQALKKEPWKRQHHK